MKVENKDRPQNDNHSSSIILWRLQIKEKDVKNLNNANKIKITTRDNHKL